MHQKDFIDRHIEYLANAVAHILGLQQDKRREEVLKGIASLKKNMPSGDGKNLLVADTNDFEILMNSTYFQGDKWSLLKEIRHVFEIEAETYLANDDKENAKVSLTKAQQIQLYLNEKGLVVWGEEDKLQKYQRIAESLE